MQLIPEPIGGQDKGRPGKLAHLTELEITAYLQQVMLMWGTRPALLRAEGGGTEESACWVYPGKGCEYEIGLKQITPNKNTTQKTLKDIFIITSFPTTPVYSIHAFNSISRLLPSSLTAVKPENLRFMQEYVDQPQNPPV